MQGAGFRVWGFGLWVLGLRLHGPWVHVQLRIVTSLATIAHCTDHSRMYFQRCKDGTGEVECANIGRALVLAPV